MGGSAVHATSRSKAAIKTAHGASCIGSLWEQDKNLIDKVRLLLKNALLCCYITMALYYPCIFVALLHQFLLLNCFSLYFPFTVGFCVWIINKRTQHNCLQKILWRCCKEFYIKITSPNNTFIYLKFIHCKKYWVTQKWKRWINLEAFKWSLIFYSWYTVSLRLN